MNDSVIPPLVSGAFPTQGHLTNIVYDRGVAQPAMPHDGAEVAIYFDADSGQYSVVFGNQTLSFGRADAVSTASDFQFDTVVGNHEARLRLGQVNYGPLFTPPRYVREGSIYSDTLNFIDDEHTYSSASFVYGFASDAAVIPNTGKASFGITMLGSRSGDGTVPYDTLTLMTGSGSVLVDFADGTLALNAATYSTNTKGQGFSSFLAGTVNATGSITSGENAFSGTFTASNTDANGPLTYTGEWSGSFFGPSGDEIGGTLYGTDGDDFFSASFAGTEDADVLASQTLASLTGQNRFRGVNHGYRFAGATTTTTPLLPIQTVTLDAGTGTWTVPSSLFQIAFEPRNREPANDADDLLAYRTTMAVAGNGEVEHRIGLFDGSAQGVTLTYSSFARVTGIQTDAANQQVSTSLDWVSFGIATPLDQLPVTGKASYSGALLGTLRSGADIVATFGGESLLDLDFSTRALSAILMPAGMDANGQPIAFDVYSFSGDISAVNGQLTGVQDGGTGNLLGLLFGDSAQEYIANFTVTDAAIGTLDGVSFGTINR